MRSGRPALPSRRSRSATPPTSSDPAERLYTLDYYLRLAERIVAAGAHVLAIKDMAGLLRAPAAVTLVSALRERFDLPVHLHTHDTAGGQLGTYLAATAAGVDAVDVAAAPMAGTTSQPPMSALVAATDHTEWATGLSLAAVQDLEPYWEAVRALYAAVRVGAALADRPGLPARDPGRSAVQPAATGHRARPRRQVRGDRGDLRGGRRHARPAGQGHAIVQGGRRPGVAPRRFRRPAGGLRGRPGPLRHPGLRHRLPVGRTRGPARWLAGAVPRQGAGRPLDPAGRDGVVRGGVDRTPVGAPAHPEPPAVPRPHPRLREGQGGVRGRRRAAHHRLPVRAAAAASSTRSRSSRASTCWPASRRWASRTPVGCAPSSRR